MSLCLHEGALGAACLSLALVVTYEVHSGELARRVVPIRVEVDLRYRVAQDVSTYPEWRSYRHRMVLSRVLLSCTIPLLLPC